MTTGAPSAAQATVTDRIARFAADRHILPDAVDRLLHSTFDDPLEHRQGPYADSGPVWACAAAVLRMGVSYGLPAESAREAAAVGAEVAIRLHAAAGRQLRARGWDAYAGPVLCGTAVGAGRVLFLPVAAMRRCIGIAATQVAGLSAAGDAWRRFQLSRAVASGIEAAQLADVGLTAPADGLGGRRGLLAVMAPDANSDVLVDRLGHRWLLAETHEGRTV